MRHGSLFSGIGGFDLAAEWMGWDNVFHCEFKEFNKKVLKYYWPNAVTYSDIRTTDFTIHRGQIDILTGGFPCQPYSQAGKRLGKEDDRHLWPEMLRAIREIQPTWIVGENVRGIINWSDGLVFEQVQADLETEGYEVQPFLLPAAGVGAPHERYRVWFVAYSGSSRLTFRPSSGWHEKQEWIQLRTNRFSREWSSADSNQQHGNISGLRTGEISQQQETGIFKHSDWEEFPTVSPVHNGNDGIPSRLDGITFSRWRNESIQAGGNAIVPQVALQIFKAIEAYNNL